MTSLLNNKNALLLFLVFSLGVLFRPDPAAALRSLQTGGEAPDFSLKTLAGEARKFGDLKGDKLTVVVFWSTWSAKSASALERMEALYEKYRGEGLAVIAVNADGQVISPAVLTAVNGTAEKLKLTFPVLLDPGLIAFRDYGIIALPTTVILDRERTIRYQLPGYPLVRSEEMADFIVASIEGEKERAAEATGGYRPDPRAMQLYNMGRNMLRSRSTADTAEMWFRKAIAADPAFILPRLGLGMMYLERDEADLALKEFKEALSREPGNAVALCEAGLILVNQGRWQEGTAMIETAVKGDRSYPVCYSYAGYAYGKAGRSAEAARMFVEAQKANPRDYKAYVLQGKLFEATGEVQKAADAYRKAVEAVLPAD